MVFWANNVKAEFIFNHKLCQSALGNDPNPKIWNHQLLSLSISRGLPGTSFIFILFYFILQFVYVLFIYLFIYFFWYQFQRQTFSHQDPARHLKFLKINNRLCQSNLHEQKKRSRQTASRILVFVSGNFQGNAQKNVDFCQ